MVVKSEVKSETRVPENSDPKTGILDFGIKNSEIENTEIENSILTTKLNKKEQRTVWKNEKKRAKTQQKKLLGFFRSKTLKNVILSFGGFDLKNPKKIFLSFCPLFFVFPHCASVKLK